MTMWLLVLSAAVHTQPRAGFLSARTSMMTGSRSASKAIAITDVLTLLQGMRDRTNTQIETDKSQWATYTAWSDKQESDKQQYLTETKSVKMTATSTMNANLGQVTTLDESLGLLTSDISETTNSLREITGMREQEHQLHTGELEDLSSTISSVNKAITILESKYTAANLAQVKKQIAHAMQLAALSKLLAPEQQKTLDALVQQPDAATDYGSYTSAAGEGGSTVVGTLKSLRATLMENKQASIEKENDARRSYEDTKKTKDDDLARMQKEQVEKGNQRTEASAAANAASAEISQADENIGDGEDFLKLLQADRAHFQTLFNERLTARNTELSATQAALDALQEVSLTTALTQIKKRGAAGLIQASSLQRKIDALASKLEALGKTLKSADMVNAGMAVASLTEMKAKAHYSPEAMEPVKELLRQLIDRLEDELSAEMSHKEWCDTEKATSAAAKLARESLISELQAEIPQLETQIAAITSEINFCTAEITRTHEEVEAAKTLRASSKAAFSTSNEDHNQVIEALTQAISAMSSVSFGFVQTGQKASVSASPFTAASSEASGASSATEMLTDLLDKYSTARAQMTAEENAAIASHEQFLEVSEKFRTDTEQTKAASTSERRLKENRLSDARSELTNAGTELQQVTQYLADLRPSCDDIRVTFEERKKRREAEISALKETLSALSDLASAR